MSFFIWKILIIKTKNKIFFFSKFYLLVDIDHQCTSMTIQKDSTIHFQHFFFFFIISAADLYIKDFIHPIVKEGHMEAVPLRIYYRHRWVQTVPEVVLQYCLLEMSASQGNFRMPSREEVDKHRIIITTLKTARYLCDLDLPQGQCPQEIQNLSMIFVFFKNLFFFL